MTKLLEGAHNRCFKQVMDNGVHVIARLLGPHLAPSIVTASEVATLDFLRSELDVPVPKVFAWSDTKNQSVGVEYTIMEKARGVELWKVWPSVSVSDKVDVTAHLANIQAKMYSTDFGVCRSLYYQDPSQVHFSGSGFERFSIGPSVGAQFRAGERKEMDLPRGPCKSS